MKNTIELSSQEDPLHLTRLADFILANWAWWCSGAVVGLLLAVFMWKTTEPRYEAQMLVKLGLVLGQKVVESPDDVALRMQSPAFQRDVMKALAASGHVNGSWSVSSARDSNLMNIRLVGRRDDLLPLSEAVLQQMTLRHNALFDPVVAALQQQLDSVQGIDDEAELGRRSLTPGERAGTSMVVTPHLRGRAAERGYWQQYGAELRQLMSYPNTRTIALVEPVVVSDAPVFPRLSSFGLMGLLLGAIAGFLLSLVWRAVKAVRSR